MSTALVPVDQLERMANAVAKSGLFGCKTVEQALGLMMIAQAEGVHPAKAVQEYHVIDGRPALRADALLARYQGAGGRVEWTDYTDQRVAARFTHPQAGSIEIDWTLERAAKAGLASRSMWTKYPRQMLRSRVISEGVRASFPGLAVGTYTVEEVQDMVVDETPASGPRDVTPPKPAPAPIGLEENELADHLAAIAGSADLDELKRAFRTGYGAAKKAGDASALEQLETAKTRRKTELTAEVPA